MTHVRLVSDNSPEREWPHDGPAAPAPDNRHLNRRQFGRRGPMPDTWTYQDRQQRVLDLLAQASYPRDRRQ